MISSPTHIPIVFFTLSPTSSLRFELAYTHTMYYLAQVYKNLGESNLCSVKDSNNKLIISPKSINSHFNLIRSLLKLQYMH